MRSRVPVSARTCAVSGVRRRPVDPSSGAALGRSQLRKVFGMARSALPPDGRILFTHRDHETFAFLCEAFESAFVLDGTRWDSLAHWRAAGRHGASTLRDALRAKFTQQRGLVEALRATGDAQLVDDSLEGTHAANALGVALMRLRAELAEVAETKSSLLDELMGVLAQWGP